MEKADGLDIFLQVCRSGSFAAAARQVNVSTASVSRQIATLEDRLKVRLFNRGQRALTLTEGGEMLLRRVRPLLEQLEDALDEIALLEARPRGLLRVGARAVAAEWLITALPRFLEENPEVDVELLVLSDEDADLVASNIDVDIRYTRPNRTDLIARLLAPASLVLVASPAYLAVHGTPLTPADLRDHDIILYQPITEQTNWSLRDRDGRTTDITPKGRLRVNDGFALGRAAVAGIGIGLLPLKEAEREILSGRLVRLLPDHPVVQPTIGGDGIFAVYQRVPYQTGKLRVFLAFLQTVFAAPASA